MQSMLQESFHGLQLVQCCFCYEGHKHWIPWFNEIFPWAQWFLIINCTFDSSWHSVIQTPFQTSKHWVASAHQITNYCKHNSELPYGYVRPQYTRRRLRSEKLGGISNPCSTWNTQKTTISSQNESISSVLHFALSRVEAVLAPTVY